MSKEGFDISNRVSKKKFSFRSFIKTEKMKTQNTKRNRVEKMVFNSILSIYSFITFGGIIVILRNINEVSFNF